MKRSLLLLLFLGIATTAFAQIGELWVSLGNAHFGNNSLGNAASLGIPGDWTVDANFRFGFRFCLNNESHFGHEFGYAYNHAKLTIPTFGDTSMPVHQGMYNFLLYGLKEGSRVRPFATGGVGFSTFYPSALGASVFSGNGVTKFGFNYGGGIKTRISQLFGIRVDFRQYVQGKPDFGTAPSGLLRINEFSGGFGILF